MEDEAPHLLVPAVVGAALGLVGLALLAAELVRALAILVRAFVS